jgi:CRP/FNR family cyclic AMP-dependent transcriptional regulator
LRNVARAGGLLELIPDDERRRVLATAPRRRFARGETVFHEGDPGDSLHVIAKGHVAVRATTALGDVATFRVLGSGDIFGEQALLVADAHRVATVVALETVETHILHKDDFDALRLQHREVDRFLVEALVLQVRRLSTHLQEALFVPSEVRVLRRLAELCESYRTHEGRAVIPLTQEDIASLAGTSRPTANRVLKAAEDEGVLLIGRRRIEVLDAEGLARRAS